ncbi:MAG: hypothetical protein H6867_00565 [Rhodospirillales bacterium]|nr:hypothetical protein [Rhodospirillales bacterium]MCB9996849.1 hypothetical protein [Rhodospirillales bacterium]
MKKQITGLGLAFALAAGGALAEGQKHYECRSETEQPMSIQQLLEPVPAGRAVSFLLLLDKESQVWERFKQAEPSEFGGILNEAGARTVVFDADSAYKISDKLFETLPMIAVHVCQPESKADISALIKVLEAMDGVKHAAPNSTLEEVPVIHGWQGTAPLP